MPEELQKVECLYVGLRELGNGKLAEGYLTLECAKGLDVDAWDVAERAVSLFERKGRASVPLIVGGIYHMEVKLEGDRINTAKTNGKEYLRRWDKREWITAWEVRHDAAQTADRVRKVAERVKKDPMIDAELVALRGLYQRTPYADRTALEMLVLRRMRGGKP